MRCRGTFYRAIGNFTDEFRNQPDWSPRKLSKSEVDPLLERQLNNLKADSEFEHIDSASMFQHVKNSLKSVD